LHCVGRGNSREYSSGRSYGVTGVELEEFSNSIGVFRFVKMIAHYISTSKENTRPGLCSFKKDLIP